MEINRHESAPDQLNRQRMRGRARRNWFSGLNAGVSTLLFLLLAIMVNILSLRHHTRLDWSRAQFYALSGKTTTLVQSLEQPLRVIVFIQPSHEVYHHLYDDTLNLLREYAYASGGRITVERVDPDRNLGRAEEIMSRFQLDQANVVIFAYGDQFRVVPAADITGMDYLPVARGGLPQPVNFRGEQVFTSAILSLTDAKPPRVYFMQGYGERDFEDHDPYVGLSVMGRQIRRDNIELIPFNFAERSTLPDDAAALIVAGPTRPYSAKEVERIQSYINRAGSLILMLSSETDGGFAGLLEQWGINGANNALVDPARTVSGFDVLISSYNDHPVTERLQNFNCVFYWPRALVLRNGENETDAPADKPRARALALSSSRAWADFNLDQQPYQFDEGRDIRGRLPMAVAIERGAEATKQMGLSRARAVVFGDVDFISNSGLSGANADLFMNALNWVLQREKLIDIAPKPVEQVRLLINRKHLARLFWSVVVGLPAVMALTGCFVWWRRRE